MVRAPVKPMPPEEVEDEEDIVLECDCLIAFCSIISIRYRSESHAVPFDMPLQSERCVIQWCKERFVWEHGKNDTPVRCNLSPSSEQRKDWKS